MKIIKIILVFLIIPIFSQCQQLHYSKKITSAGPAYLTLNPDNTYEYIWYRFYDVGPIEDKIFHTGIWIKTNDTLILNSYNTPDNYDFIVFNKEAEVKPPDSIKILITSNDSIPFFLIAPDQIRINERYFQLPGVNLEEIIEFSLPRFPIDYIIIPGYPVYKAKNKNSNFFHFIIKETSGLKYRFPANTFFLNEKFLIKGDTLYQLRNNELETEFVKDK